MKRLLGAPKPARLSKLSDDTGVFSIRPFSQLRNLTYVPGLSRWLISLQLMRPGMKSRRTKAVLLGALGLVWTLSPLAAHAGATIPFGRFVVALQLQY
jgi:hypothetical protein